MKAEIKTEIEAKIALELQETLKRIDPCSPTLSAENIRCLRSFLVSGSGCDLLATLIIALGCEDSCALLSLHAQDACSATEMVRAIVRCHRVALGDETADLLNALCLFEGTFSLDAAGSVCNGLPDDILDAFMARCLVFRQIEGEEVRYSLHPVVREAMSLQLPPSTRDAARCRFQQWYMNFAAEARPRLLRTPDKSVLKRLDTESANIACVLRSRQVDLSFVVCLWRWWYHRGHYEEGITALKSALVSAEEFDPFRAEALRATGLLLHKFSNAAEAERYLRLAVVRAKQENNLGLMADALNDLGAVSLHSGRHDESLQRHRHALKVASIVADVWAQGSAENGIGLHYLFQGDYDEAYRHLNIAINIYEKSKDVFQFAKILANSAGVLKHRKDYNKAIDALARCCEIFEGFGDRSSYLSALFSLADCELYVGNYSLAQKHFLTVLHLANELGYTSINRLVCANLAIVALRAGDMKRSATLFGASDALHRDCPSPLPVSDSDSQEIEDSRDIVRSNMRTDAWNLAVTSGERLSILRILDMYNK